MTNRPIRLAFGLPILAASLLLAAPGAALADCMMPPPVDNAAQTADIVFVGVVSATSQGNRWADVAVQEVWRGPDMPATVVIQGGPAGNAATSVDRSFEVGRTYLFFPYVDQTTGVLADNSCTNTTEWTEDLAKLRPADARKPLGAETTSGDIAADWLLPAGIAIVVFGGLLVVGLLARGRQET
jgi:hypothetical protein